MLNKTARGEVQTWDLSRCSYAANYY